MDNREKAKEILYREGYTCVFHNGEDSYTSTRRGVAPLLQRLDSGKDYSGYSAADKVIGRGAAFLYVLLGIKNIYVKVISRPSLQLLEENGVDVVYDELVEAIRNRDNTGFCPIESCVKGIDTPQNALVRIRERTAQLQAGK